MEEYTLKKLAVNLENGKGYNILIGYDIISKVGRNIKRLNLGDNIFLITSPNIGKLYVKSLVDGLKYIGYKHLIVKYVPDGERYKNIKSYEKLIDQISLFGINDDKKIFIINLGGGVIGDLGGFVAATYKRGINYIQIPTTLLAFVDCGIGGKVGVDLKNTKNIVGSFYQPKLVYADLSLLKTLNKRELKSGLAEVVKYGVIHSPKLFEFVENNIDKIFLLDKKIIEKIVIESYSIKADIVSKDEFDTKDIRIKLNFGHTIGHAIEAASKYAYRHGEAVSIGMVCANDIAVKLGLLDKNIAARIENLLIKIGLPVKIKKVKLSEIIYYFWRDKKFVNGVNRFIFAKGIGKVKIVENIPINIVKAVIKSRFTNNKK